jgi:uncharacterized membrane protein
MQGMTGAVDRGPAPTRTDESDSSGGHGRRARATSRDERQELGPVGRAGARVAAQLAARATTGAVGTAARIPPAVVVIALTVLSLFVCYRHDLPCANGHPKPDVLWSKGCYSDVLPLYSARGLSQGQFPYLDHDVEYPVLLGVFMAVIGLPVHSLGSAGSLDGPAHALGFETVDQGVVFFWATAAVLGILALITTSFMLRLRRDRPWDVALLAVAPVLMFHATINWDLLAVAFTTVGLYAWSREHPAWAGVFLGLGTATKLYPLLILGPIVLLCLRVGTRRTRRAAIVACGSAAIAWLAVNLPFMVLAWRSWLETYKFSEKRWIDWGSLWFILDNFSRGIGAADLVQPFIRTVPALNRVSAALFILGCVGIGLLILVAPRRPRVASMAFLVVAVFLLTNKVWSPQFVLWLLPLAVLARPRWGAFLLWQGAEVGYLFAVMRTVLGERDGYGLDQASIVRWVAVASMVTLVVVETLRPERDVVRRHLLDDPDVDDPDAHDPDSSDPDGGVLNRVDLSP